MLLKPGTLVGCGAQGSHVIRVDTPSSTLYVTNTRICAQMFAKTNEGRYLNGQALGLDPQHFLNFAPLPHEQGRFGLGFFGGELELPGPLFCAFD